MITLYNGDMLVEMDKIPDNSVDAIITDLPFGTTSCAWDNIIPFDEMWKQYNRVIKENGAIVLFGSQPFTTKLIDSNIENFKYEWIYQKRVGSNFMQAEYQPIKEHENILVFTKDNSKPTFYPIKEQRKGGGLSRIQTPYHTNSSEGGDTLNNVSRTNAGKKYDDLKFPSSVQEFNNRAVGARGLHPTQKPVALLEYLIKTYTNKNEVVLDSTMGSGTTGVACDNLERKFIGIELDEKYFSIAKERIEKNVTQLELEI